LKITGKHYIPLIIFICLGGTVAFWLLIFTLSDGFATFNNDSANYVLLAKKWSPYFVPSTAVVATWPMQSFPVIFPLVLALSGFSESLLLCHLLVSGCLILSLGLIYFRLKQGFNVAICLVVTLSIGMLPGMFVNSMGILSENLYMLLSILLIFSILNCISKGVVNLTSILLLGALTLIVINTRTIGVAILPALLVVIIFDRTIESGLRVRLGLIVVVTALICLVWSLLYAFEGSTSYIDLIKPSVLKSIYGLETKHIGLAQIIQLNIAHLPYAWNEYLTLFFHQSYLPFAAIFSLTLLCLIQICTVVRAVYLKLDALYLVFYFIILLLWPYPISDRFLHPLVILMLLQPLFLANECKNFIRKFGLVLYPSSLLILLAHSIFVHSELLDRKMWAITNQPTIEMYWELYKEPDARQAVKQALHFHQIFDQSTFIKNIVPENNIIAANKPVFVALLAERTTVPLKTNISFEQQLCNFQIKNVDFLYFSKLVTDYSTGGINAVSNYEAIVENQFLVKTQKEHVATLAKINKKALSDTLDGIDVECSNYDLFPQSN
jgi:hypothetical protein